MTYYLNLFSPETFEAFNHSDRETSGFRYRQRNVASQVKVGDRLLCYMTKLSRWIGILEVTKESYQDDSPIFYDHDDPFVIRLKVKPIVWLDKEEAIPIKQDRVWNALGFTKDHKKNSSAWTGKLRVSLNRLDVEDAEFLERILIDQSERHEKFPLDEREYEKLVTLRIRRLDKTVSVSVPTDSDEDEEETSDTKSEIRESLQIQDILAKIGNEMGLRIWMPKHDRTALLASGDGHEYPLLETLPLNYDETTLKTIEQIDVLWLRGRSIVRAFEVEHTTSIYSGILRMADLLALQPNMDINLHIVAPDSRRDKVFRELLRPVFSLLEKGPLSETCTYLSYDSVREISELPHLTHLSDNVLEEYSEEAE
jgi:predicted RNA-binding protein